MHKSTHQEKARVALCGQAGKAAQGAKHEFAEPECGGLVCHRSNHHAWSPVVIKPQQQITLCVNGPILI